MQKQIQTLQNVVSRKGSSKILTFSVPHVFKALQLLHQEKYVSRSEFCKQLHIGEGAVKTLISHLKEVGIGNSTKSGTFLTEKGKKLAKKLFEVISSECMIAKCKIFRSKFNFAVILRGYAHAIKTGLEQRDYAILYGASGAVTMLYNDNRFTFPEYDKDCLVDDNKTKNQLLSELSPKNGDAIIIACSDDSFVAEISAKNSALWTLATS